MLWYLGKVYLSKRCEYFFHRCLLFVWIEPRHRLWCNNNDKAAQKNMEVCMGCHLHHLHYLNR